MTGGTGDITVHEVQDDHTLHEINMATGGPWGGNRINEAFLDIWKEVLGKKVMVNTTVSKRFLGIWKAFLGIWKDILRKKGFSK